MLIDVTRLVHRKFRGRLPTGVDRVSLAYVERYGARSAALLRLGRRWQVLRHGDSQHVFDALISGELRSTRQLAWRLARALPMRSAPDARHRALLNTGHSGLEQPRYAVEVRRRGLRPLYFVHDLIPITHPEFTRPGEDDRHRQRLQTVLDTGAALVVNSQATRLQLAEYARRIGRRLPDCVVAPLAPAALPAPASRAPLDRPYFVVVGTVEPRKNHLLLLQVWRRLAEELGDAAPRLVIIGQRGWKCAPVLSFLEQCTALRDFVIARPHCSDGDLATWLQHAQALLFPSFVEGFGLPLAEALALRVPVIASNLPAFNEVAGDIPELLDPLDGPAWHQAVRDYMQPDGQRPRMQRQRMSGYVAPTWSAHFSVVDALVDSCLRPAGQVAPQAGWIHAARS